MTQPPDALSSRDFAEWNERMVERYDIERYYEQSHPLVRWVEQRRLSALRALAAPSGGDRVLEVGCGAGHVLELFAGQPRTGVDLSPLMLERTRRRLGAGVTLLQASAEQLPFGDGSFDIVLCTEVLEHTREPARVIAELMRVATTRARVVVSIPNERNIDRAKRTLARVPLMGRLLGTLAAEENEWHLHHFDADRLRAVVRGSADIAQLRGVPFAVAPVRYAALLRRAGTR